MYSHVFAHLSKHSQQHGFWQSRLCKTQLIITINDLAESLNRNEQTDVIFLDFSKAFDKVSHRHLFHKLNHYGIWGDLLTWIKSFVSNRVQQVVVDGQQSNLTVVLSSVPQGTVLAPLLFLCFINDLLNGIMSKIKLYVYDVLLYTTIYSSTMNEKPRNMDVEWIVPWK